MEQKPFESRRHRPGPQGKASVEPIRSGGLPFVIVQIGQETQTIWVRKRR